LLVYTIPTPRSTNYSIVSTLLATFGTIKTIVHQNLIGWKALSGEALAEDDNMSNSNWVFGNASTITSASVVTGLGSGGVTSISGYGVSLSNNTMAGTTTLQGNTIFTSISPGVPNISFSDIVVEFRKEIAYLHSKIDTLERALYEESAEK